ncbi:hypothetical protein VMCG_04968 [Cytospora schulzeri]|uniref:Uncharacterized protein n=1 Tax=Cytospora schulzeri TaxID=448051 RepID=A0A423WMB4_9PEZI|nr:hypothetical protein VMCG_04968 [Valsa malicola]
MPSTPVSEEATSNEAKTTPPPRKRRAVNSKAGSGRSSKRRATTPCRITRSRFKRMSEKSSTPQSLNPGLEMSPRRWRTLAGGQRATTAAPRPPYAIVEASVAPERLENKSPTRTQKDREVSEADITADSRLAQAAIEAGLTTESPAGDVVVPEPSQGHEKLREHDPANSIAEVVDGAKATQDSAPAEQSNTSSPSASTISPETHKIDGGPEKNHDGTECDQPCPVAVVGDSLDQGSDETVETEPKAAPEVLEARGATGADTDAQITNQGKTKGQPPIPWLPDRADSFRPQWEWSTSWRIQSQTQARGYVEVSPNTQHTPPLIRSGGIGGEVETPIQHHTPGGSNFTLPWQPEANRAIHTAGAAQIVSADEHQALTGPLPPAVVQCEPAPYSVEGCQYSPEVFPADFEEYEPEDCELEEWDDDVDP